jgi:NAD(P)-dependent dehydrogenase (short-subunit alcohol dehydrogenase family)
MRSLQGRAILISGGGSGLGRAIALRLATCGAHPVVGDVNAAAAQETVQLIEAAGGRGTASQLDVTDPISTARVVGETADRFGTAFDGLVNNAGTDRGAGMLDISDEQWQSVIAVNQSGPLYLTRAFLRALDVSVDRVYPADVVNVISISAITVGADAAAYNSSKAALAMLTKVMQREAYEYRWPVRVHGLMPSAMNTPMMQQWHLSDDVMMAPDTVAGAVEFMMTLPPDTFVQNLVINSRREPGWPR